MLRIVLLAVLLPALGTSIAQPLAPSVQNLAKPATAGVADKPAATQAGPRYHWYENGQARALLLDADLEADFATGKAVVVRNKGLAPAAGAQRTSPVFRDADSPAVRRALPGGIIVVTRGRSDADILNRLLAPRGLAVARQLGTDGTRWLIHSAPGMASLEAANQLQESGDFAAVEPNWWRERVLK